MPLLHGDITDVVLRSYYHVYNTLGYGFLEKVYENALSATLSGEGIHALQQVPIDVHFEGRVVGSYFADLLVAKSVIVEVKAAEALCKAHVAQTLNYLKATDVEVALLLNFGAENPEFQRLVFTNDRKRLRLPPGNPS
jgi:GxxExxY protein